MIRITALTNKMNPQRKKIVNDSLSWLDFNNFFSPEIEKFRLHLRKTLEKEVLPLISKMYEKAEYPNILIPILYLHWVGIKKKGTIYGYISKGGI